MTVYKLVPYQAAPGVMMWPIVCHLRFLDRVAHRWLMADGWLGPNPHPATQANLRVSVLPMAAWDPAPAPPTAYHRRGRPFTLCTREGGFFYIYPAGPWRSS